VSARQIMTADEVRRALVRIGHEIVEKHGGAADLALVGILRRGVPLAERLADAIADHEGARVPVGSLDITFHRDDLRPGHEQPELRATNLPFDLAASTVVIVDDVLYTGRTVRAAMDTLIDHGRPAAVRLAVLVDRGHRELPIRADHVGKNVPTSREEVVRVRLREIDGGDDEVLIERADEPLAMAGSAQGAGAS
jgi:pyrimidine operon attenuation protein / uracil phosphoribosyltransferase